MQKIIDLTGNRYGKLIVTGTYKQQYLWGCNRTYWQVTCDCGQIFWGMRERLVNGRLKQCKKCSTQFHRTQLIELRKKYKPTFRLPLGESSFNRLFSTYKKNAKVRNLIFELTKEQFKSLTQQNCYYCNEKPKNIVLEKNAFGAYIYNGIDRKDNYLGYTVYNSVTCCEICNKAKQCLTIEEFKCWINKIYINLPNIGEK